MKRILNGAANLAKRLYHSAIEEPVAVRGAIAAIVNVLILSGAVGAPFAEDVDKVVEGVLLAVANVGLLLSARARVSPIDA